VCGSSRVTAIKPLAWTDIKVSSCISYANVIGINPTFQGTPSILTNVIPLCC
jgi:hypothetical protein